MKRASLPIHRPPPEPQQTHRASWYTPGLSDGLGDRLLMFDDTTASSLELLRFKREFGDAPGFEGALRRRVDELNNFRHPLVVNVRAVEWLGDEEGLALISNHTAGRRLSEVLHHARDATLATGFLRQLGPALSALHQHADGIAHGALTPDRVIVTPEGRLVLVEQVLGPALDSLNLSADRLKADLGIAVPPDRYGGSLDPRTDVVQLAFIALSVLLGRRLDPSDYPDKIGSLLELAEAGRKFSAGAPRLRGWLERAFQLNGRTFASALEAHDALADALEIGPGTPAGSFTKSASRVIGHQPGEREVHRMDEQLQRREPVIRHGATFFEFRPPEFTPAEPVVDASRWLEAAQSQADRSGSVEPSQPRQAGSGRAAWWAIAGLAVVAGAQTFFIAGLISGRRAVTPAAAVAAAPVLPNTEKPGVPQATRGQPAGITTPTPPPTAPPIPTVPTPSRLEITSDPPGARVTVDGTRRGVTPLAIPIGPGPHSVIISDGNTTTSRTVNVQAGGTATVIAALASAGGAAGWLSISTPLELQVHERGTLLGTTSAARLMLPAGRHELELANAAVGFQTTLSVEVQPGKNVAATVTIPNGSMSLNALPWANVWLDGRALGTTPVANLEVRLGTHEVVWRHPQFGERRQTVVVTASSPLRLVMDLNK